MGRIDMAARQGRVDLYIQSTDKNLLVPVGGSIIAGFDKKVIDAVSKTYPGRASMSPIMDVFLTLITMGESGWTSLLKERKQNTAYFRKKLAEVAAKYGERLLETEANPISLAITIDSFELKDKRGSSYMGAMLFQRCVSGPRTVPKGIKKSVCGIDFTGYGSHTDAYPHTYLVLACAIGTTKAEIDLFIQRLEKVMKEVRKEQKKLEKRNKKAITANKAAEDVKEQQARNTPSTCSDEAPPADEKTAEPSK
eukprot:CAMPEP_0170197510 /NCGR_PEP_ID=MMETSP0040_2-20121228/66579_1 /TAXON_ID=641309 /ORGANISM="Lotharella oceanica, Strain CCMP622" /LENGTH=251 /DNA_ID=CAMNT_0010447199 /DNA_START=54 /DNA_END=809 /DNA_ORIENTATION=-